MVDDVGQRRLDDPRDYVRLEIATALQRNVRVIPTLVHNASMPRESDLPEPLRPLTRLNAFDLSASRWDYDVGRLLELLKRIPPRPLVPETGRAIEAGVQADVASTQRNAAPSTVLAHDQRHRSGLTPSSWIVLPSIAIGVLLAVLTIGVVALVMRATQSPAILTFGPATAQPTSLIAAAAVSTPLLVGDQPAVAATLLPREPTVLPTSAPTPRPTPLATAAPPVTAAELPVPTLDVRREAAALNLPWSSQGFADALTANDERAVKLYLAGGMSATELNNRSSVVLYLLQHPGRDPIPILQLLIDNNFDVNTLLVDRKLMWTYGASGEFSDDIGEFHSPDTPAVHLEFFDFRGPPLLWVVINSAYWGTSATDVTIVDFLLAHGASDHVAKQYLEQVERIDGQNDDSRALHKALYRSSS
jgi:hypothetical protein